MILSPTAQICNHHKFTNITVSPGNSQCSVTCLNNECKPRIRSRLLVFSISVSSVWCIIYIIFLWKTCIEKGRTFKGCILSCVQRVRKLARRASQYQVSAGRQRSRRTRFRKSLLGPELKLGNSAT